MDRWRFSRLTRYVTSFSDMTVVPVMMRAQHTQSVLARCDIEIFWAHVSYSFSGIFIIQKLLVFIYRLPRYFESHWALERFENFLNIQKRIVYSWHDSQTADCCLLWTCGSSPGWRNSVTMASSSDMTVVPVIMQAQHMQSVLACWASVPGALSALDHMHQAACFMTICIKLSA